MTEILHILQTGTTEEFLLFGVLDGHVENVSMSASSLIAHCRYGRQSCSASQFKR